MQDPNLLKFRRYEPSEDPIRSNPNATHEERCMDPFRVGPHIWQVSGHEDFADHLIDTGAGLVLIDTPTPDFKDELFASIAKVGYDVKDITHLFITHWHGDHDGCAAAVKEASGCKIIMLAEDWGCKCNPPRKFPMAIPFYEPDEIIWEDEVNYTIGSMTFNITKGPGHTPGCMVIRFDDTDEEGNVYHCAMHGGLGAGQMATEQGMWAQFINPAMRDQFIQQCLEMSWWDVDITLANHMNHAGYGKALPEDRNNWKWFVDKRTWPVMLLERRGWVMEKRGEEKGR